MTDRNDQIKKINYQGDSISVFSDVKRYGDIYSLDVTNPLNIIVFYRDFATILFLDRFLNNINKIDLRKNGIMQCKAVAYSFDNKIWVYDQQDSRLEKINTVGTKEMSTDDFRVLFDDFINPTSIVDNEQLVYLYDPEKGFYLFDHYGGFVRNLLYLHWQDVDVIDGQIVGRDATNLFVASKDGIMLKTYQPDINWKQVKYIKFYNQHIITLLPDGIHIYKFTL